MQQDSQLIRPKTRFERAIFLSWYCSVGDCSFCYMSTQKNLITDPKRARRRLESILAEAFLCKKLGWKIEFLSAGYGSFTMTELMEIVKSVHEIYGEKLWLNVGVLGEKILERMKPYLEGACGSVESMNPDVRKIACPSKPLKDIEYMFNACNKLGLKKSMTIILGLGETLKDIPLLLEFIKKHNMDKITFYALNPTKGTIYTKGPETDYFLEWVKKTRDSFPNLEIVTGSWVNREDEINHLLKAGANAFTKFPSIKLFNSPYARRIEKEIKSAGFLLEGTLTDYSKIDPNEIDNYSFSQELRKKIKEKLVIYLSQLESSEAKWGNA